MTFTPRLTIKQVIAEAGVGVGRLEVCLSTPTLLWKGYKTSFGHRHGYCLFGQQQSQLQLKEQSRFGSGFGTCATSCYSSRVGGGVGGR